LTEKTILSSAAQLPSRDEIEQAFREAYEIGRAVTITGKVADYIPELAKANPRAFGVAMLDGQGNSLAHGDADARFSIQSVCKVIILAFSLKARGFRETFSHVMMEPSGDAFNSILKLDTRSNLPFNPLINAGAIQLVSTLADEFSFEDLTAFARELCMDEGIRLDEAVYHSEFESGDRNRAIAYLLKSKGVLQGEPEKTLDLYFKMCSLNVNARSLSKMGLLLANRGQNPFNGKHIIHPGYIRTIKSLMFTCGMYDQSGEYGVLVGLPSKSGVGGGITATVTGRWGIGTYGPALNEKGNSAGGIAALQHLSHLLRLNTFA
jgi:glutaminase